MAEMTVKLHTIISREIIKPATPTPSHPDTYNFSEIDSLAYRGFLPLLLFYRNNDSCGLTAQDKAMVLKKSLSQSLTRYYHFAGRLPTNTTPYVDCNDEGVVFIEARSDSTLDTFTSAPCVDHLFADDMVCLNSPRYTNVVWIQLNHFACGGVGLAVSMSHLVGDGCTLASFLSHWAAVALYGSTDHDKVLPLNPYFIHFPRANSPLLEDPFMNQPNATTHVMRKFVFPDSKLSDLKKAVAPGSVNNPTRFEALTSLLYKTAVAAATTNSGGFKPSYLFMMANIRKKFVEKLPETAVGNFASMMQVSTRHPSETSLSMLVAEIKKQKLQLEGLQSVDQAAEHLKSAHAKLFMSEDLQHLAKRSYSCTSLCGFPFNKIDFGCGKPIATTLASRSVGSNFFVLMDAADGDGIEAQVILEHEDMEIFQNDSELLSFC